MAVDVIEFLYECLKTKIDDCLIDNCKVLEICKLIQANDTVFTMYYTEGEN